MSRAGFQLGQVCKYLTVRPIPAYDSEYGNASFVKQTAGIEADLLLRLRPNMCLWGAPPPYCGKGRPKVHGDKFKLADSSTWGEPVATWKIEDQSWGMVQIQQWLGLHFRACATHPMHILRITVAGKHSGKRSPKPMWLCWLGGQMPSLEQTWRHYLPWFAVDHWNRFAKPRLHWTLPHFSTTELAERSLRLNAVNQLATVAGS